MSSLETKLDLSLDDIIKLRRNGQTNVKKASFKGKSRGNENKAAPYQRPPVLPQPSEVGKILISNLQPNVTENDLRELFSQIGKVKKSSLNYDGKGRSQGSGFVIFLNSSDALLAFKRYHGVTLDGRAMKISIPFTPTEESMSIKNRLGPVNKEEKPSTKTGKVSTRTKKGRRPRSERSSRPAPSKESLDAQLDSYLNTAGRGEISYSMED